MIAPFAGSTIGPTVRGLYLELPQAFGGAKPVEVIMGVDRSAVPPELLEGSAPTESSARTAKLQLLFNTTDYYIVSRNQAPGDPAWVIQAKAIHAITRVKRVP